MAVIRMTRLWKPSELRTAGNRVARTAGTALRNMDCEAMA
jgi:hypothetical protein